MSVREGIPLLGKSSGPQPEEGCLETKSDSDSKEEEVEGVVYVDEEHADSQSVN